jgi:hypothetical protein
LGVLGDPTGTDTYNRILGILDSKDKIPHVSKINGHYYNFWQDENHVRGIWRRTTLDEFRKASPKWETVIDVDQLGKDEDVSWVCTFPNIRLNIVTHMLQAIRPQLRSSTTPIRCPLADDADMIRRYGPGTLSLTRGRGRSAIEPSSS